MNRRDLFKSAALAGVAATGALPQARAAATDRIGIGLIGCGGMGRMDLADFQKQAEAEIVAVCDVYPPNLQAAHQLTGEKARTYTDFRKLLDDRSVDAVVIATPDHWHPLIAVAACHAGKDVYVEKPVSNVVREGRLMVEAARRNRRVVQVGLQQRSGSHFQRAAKIVAVCDVYPPNLQAAHQLTGEKARTYTDFRKLLDDRSVDAIGDPMRAIRVADYTSALEP